VLHIIRQAYPSDAFERCLEQLDTKDHVVLIEDAVYALTRHDPRLQALQEQQRLHIVQADIEARGMSIASDMQIDYSGLVKLTVVYSPIVTW
jgi:tRNA 2-thiouridine synthesizing protein B